MNFNSALGNSIKNYKTVAVFLVREKVVFDPFTECFKSAFAFYFTIYKRTINSPKDAISRVQGPNVITCFCGKKIVFEFGDNMFLMRMPL